MSSQLINHNQPLIRTEKRAERTQKQAVVLRFAALLLALAVGGLFILAIGKNPFLVYKTLVTGALRSKMNIQGTIKLIIPLLITSLGVTLAFKMKFWNIGGEGQVIMGAVFAYVAGLYGKGLPHILVLLLMFIAGLIGGGLTGLLPAYFKTKFNTNETLFTLMLNYIALYFVIFLRQGPLKDPESTGMPKFAKLTANERLTDIFGVHSGWIIALILFVIVMIYIRYTKQGYEIDVVGESMPTASYAGMNVKKIILRTVFFSGGLCGIAGMISVAGTAGTLTEGCANGVGFTAIIVSWLGNLKPAAIFIITVLFCIMSKGSGVVESTFGISKACADVLQGIILFFVIGCEFFIRYKFVFRKKGGN